MATPFTIEVPEHYMGASTHIQIETWIKRAQASGWQTQAHHGAGGYRSPGPCLVVKFTPPRPARIQLIAEKVSNG